MLFTYNYTTATSTCVVKGNAVRCRLKLANDGQPGHRRDIVSTLMTQSVAAAGTGGVVMYTLKTSPAADAVDECLSVPSIARRTLHNICSR